MHLTQKLQRAMNDAKLLQDCREGLPLREHFDRCVPGGSAPLVQITAVNSTYIVQQVAVSREALASKQIAELHKLYCIRAASLQRVFGVNDDITGDQQLVAITQAKNSAYKNRTDGTP